MKGWEGALITPRTNLRGALSTIDRVGCQIALVVDESRLLVGTLSDGDVRRALLGGATLDDAVESAMHRTPTCANVGEDPHSILTRMRRLGLRQIPLLDDQRRVVGLQTLDDFLAAPDRPNRVVIMAGGLGTRLRELTRDVPKPMLRIGSRPLLETIVRSFAEQGFRRIDLAVNYKAEQIEGYFGDGSDFGVEIRYLRERERLGTAGALSLLDETPDSPILVTNADLLTKEDFGRMLDAHVDAGADATMGVREYEMQVPFGVVQARGGRILDIEEKPVHRFIVNGGIYALSPQTLGLVPRATYFDMPSLFKAVVAQGMFARCHVIDGYWLDIGQPPDLERAKLDFDEVFK